MTGPRRAAREVALRILFQVDVGKQPLEEVWEGALQPVRQQVLNPAHQAVQDAYAQVRRILSSRKRNDPGLRAFRTAAQRLLRTLRALEESLAKVVAAVISPDCTSMSPEPDTPIEEQVAAARREVEQIADWDRLEPSDQQVLQGLGDAAIRLMRDQVLRHLPAARETGEFAVRLVRGTLKHQNEIDALLAGLATTWRLDRQAAVDRNILRLGAYELLHLSDMPVAVAINEAVELAKKFSTAESGRFVNGVLGALVERAPDAQPHPKQE